MPTWAVTITDRFPTPRHPPAIFEAEAETRAEAVEMIRELMLTPGFPNGHAMAANQERWEKRVFRVRTPKERRVSGINHHEYLCRRHDILDAETADHGMGCICLTCRQRAEARHEILYLSST